ncbi:MAG: Flp family type IVb pilin [Acidobacteria bacterium]|nr:Flp family type IVb pilin [Acidobacteriota bacterium]
MKQLWNWAISLKIWKDTDGQDLVEYALLASMVTITVGALFPPASEQIFIIFSKFNSTAARVP